ncbi:MAG: DUF5828 family protein [Candidatus Nanohaloarchaeota archaeon QJJ-7]|nr:DUF5828 family protein [Candidatus Nanohaloarchaeota archaeon QJJ-7]
MERRDFALVEEGEWEEIVEFCENLSRALESTLPDENSRFREWMPKDGEGKKEVKGRTVKDESMRETGIEEESEGMKKELSRAEGEMKDSGSELVSGRPKESARKVEEAGESTARGLIPMLIKLVRGLERGIYRHLVGPVNPDYFESEEFSVTIERQIVSRDRYRCRANFQDRDLISEVEEAFD